MKEFLQKLFLSRKTIIKIALIALIKRLEERGKITPGLETQILEEAKDLGIID